MPPWPEPVSLRVLRLVEAWFAEDAGFASVGVNLLSPTPDLEVPATGYPALAVVTRATEGALVQETGGGVIEPLGLALVGYDVAPTERVPEGESEPVPLVPPPVTETCEHLVQRILRRFAGANPGGETLADRLLADRQTHGQGADGIERSAPVVRDPTYRPPLVRVEVPCVARLHYAEEAF